MKMTTNNNQSKRELRNNVKQGYRLIHTKPQEALTYFKKAYKGARDLEDDKLERTCAFNLGALYIAQGQSKEGVEYLHKAIPPENKKDDKSNGDVYFNLGLGYEKMASSATVTEQDTHRKTAVNNYRKAADEYESEKNSARQTECLGKILELQTGSGSVDEVLRAYDDLNKLLEKEEQFNKQMSFLCKKANFLRLKKKIKEAGEAADDCLNINEKVGESTDETTACTLNELGLLYTQIQQYDKATTCFEQARLIIHSHEGNKKLEAVILQNLGAAYNFVGDYQRSKTFHLQAAEKFALLRNHHSQGQCFANLAFAHSQLGDNDGAWEYFILARQAAEDSGDVNTIWQVHEGLGSVQFNRGNLEKAEEYFKKALKQLGNKNEDAFNRIVSKLKNVHEQQLLNQEFQGTRRLPGGSFVPRSFGPQQRRGYMSGTLNRSKTDPNEPQPEDAGVRETIVQPASEPPPVIYENHFYERPGLPVHANEGTLGSMRHKYETLLEQREGDEEETEGKGTTDSDTDSSSDEETNKEEEDDNRGRGQLQYVPPETPRAGKTAAATYDNIKPRQQVARQKSYSGSDDIDQGTLTGSGPYAEVDYFTKASYKSPGPSAKRSQTTSDSSFESEENPHTPRGESEKQLYQVHRELREKEAKEKETKEEGKSSKTCILM
ncbi:hypothetical protein ACJMK2_044269 [Sinanodonta woodiana]|uniref:Uncharacterized protein n=1 Tax=Sinanodonta woodiana TaxID=1069815 RepID=A0ABD3W2V6_SINWO